MSKLFEFHGYIPKGWRLNLPLVTIYWNHWNTYNFRLERRNHHEFLLYTFDWKKLTIFLTWHKTYPFFGFYQYDQNNKFCWKYGKNG